MMLNCQWCEMAAAQLTGDAIIIKARHRNEWHYTTVPMSRLLHLAAQTEETLVKCECGCAVGRAGAGQVTWWCRHKGQSHTQVWQVLRLSTLNTCEKLVELREQIGDDLPYLEASGLAFTQRDTTRRLGRLLQIIAETLQP